MICDCYDYYVNHKRNKMICLYRMKPDVVDITVAGKTVCTISSLLHNWYSKFIIH